MYAVNSRALWFHPHETDIKKRAPYMQPVNKNSTATEEELEQHVMVGEMMMSQDDVDSQNLSILV